MPFFSNKFSPKKTPNRKLFSAKEDTKRAKEDLISEGNRILLQLDNQETVFENGQWTMESGQVGAFNKDNKKLRKHIQRLNEEKNLLRLKFEVLLDLCTQTTAESHLMQREIEKLRRELKIAENNVELLK